MWKFSIGQEYTYSDWFTGGEQRIRVASREGKKITFDVISVEADGTHKSAEEYQIDIDGYGNESVLIYEYKGHENRIKAKAVTVKELMDSISFVADVTVQIRDWLTYESLDYIYADEGYVCEEYGDWPIFAAHMKEWEIEVFLKKSVPSEMDDALLKRCFDSAYFWWYKEATRSMTDPADQELLELNRLAEMCDVLREEFNRRRTTS